MKFTLPFYTLSILGLSLLLMATTCQKDSKINIPSFVGFHVSKRTTTTLDLVWRAANDPDGSITAYYLSYRKKGESNYSTEIETTAFTHTLTPLTTGTTYEIRLRAKDNDENYGPYTELEVKTLSTP